MRFEPAAQVEAEDWEAHSEQRLHEALAGLDARSCDIVKKRWLNEDDKVTLQDLADTYGISAERVRQLEKNAMNKLKTALAD
jgi:RNA polymerase sigma-32 factor